MTGRMMIDLGGRTALVTGSTKGIGHATAEGLARSGARVVLTGRRSETVATALQRLKTALGASADVDGVAVDLSTEEGCSELIHRHPSVDVLVNNLGKFDRRDFFSTSDDTWRDFFETNVLAGIRLARAYLPKMVESGWGRVIFVSSESAFNVPRDMIHYAATKTACVAIASGLSKLVGRTGVTVNSVLPGPTSTEGLGRMLEVGGGTEASSVIDEFVRDERSSSSLGRAVTVDEVANLILYAASPGASATTGAALRVDGGVMESI